MIHLSGTECKGQYCRGEVFRGDILRRDMKKLEAIAKECGVELKAAESDSLFARIFRYRRRTGLMAGAAAAAAAVLLMSQMLTTIDIQGNSAVSDEIIIAALDQLGVKEGSFLPCTDLRSCEKQLPFLIDEVAWAGIRRTGNSIVVQIREAEPEPDMLRTRPQRRADTHSRGLCTQGHPPRQRRHRKRLRPHLCIPCHGRDKGQVYRVRQLFRPLPL